MAIDVDLISEPKPSAVELAAPLSDALLAALLELAESAERNQASREQEPRLDDAAKGE